MRRASHANSWYSGSASQLDRELSDRGSLPFKSLAREEGDIESRVQELAEQLAAMEQGLDEQHQENAAAARQALEEATEALEDARAKLDEEALPAAEESSQQGLNRMEEALERLQAVTQAEQQERREAAARQDFLRGRTTEARRELEEEIGTRAVEIVGETRGWISYELPSEMRGGVWKGRYVGQTQKWFAARFLGEDRDIDLNTDHPEFNDWRWVAIDALPGLIVPFKRPAYEAVVAELEPVVRGAVG